MLHDLLRLHEQYPNAIIGHRVRHLKLNAPYRLWKRYKEYRYLLKSLKPKFGNVQTGVGGVLYPPHSLKLEMLDSKIFMEIAPTTDDIWFWAAAVANGTKIAPVPFGDSKLNDLRKPVEICLLNTNLIMRSGNDVNRTVLEEILEKYPVIKQRVENEIEEKNKKSFFKPIKRLLWRLQIIIYEKKFNGKPLNEVQSGIQEIIGKREGIYFRDENAARQLADSWHGMVQKPQNLRFIENAIPVVMCANENFAPYLAVMLQSLLERANPQRKYHFMVFESNISEKSKECLTKQTTAFAHCYIDVVNVRPALDGIPLRAVNHVSIDAFSRLFIPYWLDKYKKVIYLDCDMIAKADIAELYDLDLKSFCIGICSGNKAVRCVEQKKYGYFMKRTVFMFLKNWHRYINSGVLVFDVKKFAERFPYHDFFSFAIYFTNRYAHRLNDQDVLALLIKDDYFVLPPEWNYSWSEQAGKGKYLSAKPNTKIIHFAGKLKPWSRNSLLDNNVEVQEYRKFAFNVPLFKDTAKF
jgi:lipopolysaccharide biosynthesis glycosyltransferase